MTALHTQLTNFQLIQLILNNNVFAPGWHLLIILKALFWISFSLLRGKRCRLYRRNLQHAIMACLRSCFILLVVFSPDWFSTFHDWYICLFILTTRETDVFDLSLWWNGIRAATNKSPFGGYRVCVLWDNWQLLFGHLMDTFDFRLWISPLVHWDKWGCLVHACMWKDASMFVRTSSY